MQSATWAFRTQIWILKLGNYIFQIRNWFWKKIVEETGNRILRSLSNQSLLPVQRVMRSFPAFAQRKGKSLNSWPHYNGISSPVTSSEMGDAKKVHGRPVETILSQFEAPETGGWKKFLWRISLPVVYVLYYTVPDCRMEKFRTWYLVTFTMAMVWIAIFSYFMVWTITVIGGSPFVFHRILENQDSFKLKLGESRPGAPLISCPI